MLLPQDLLPAALLNTENTVKPLGETGVDARSQGEPSESLHFCKKSHHPGQDGHLEIANCWLAYCLCVCCVRVLSIEQFSPCVLPQSINDKLVHSGRVGWEARDGKAVR